ncbi:CDP-diacylglycerol--serine O-phosphatidyltransferase [Pedobacter caeni]|uniref:CDP-diacylglycerol--serine O-phosphatidyltransferase n=1 Tax=Pedobacter caeni TaxID=288992 RepID=A0A1M5ANF5_9SPHI|nr:CDP-diacylglycerol--serine O-phosphatidyltransferase [Pedobacter caeni]SHF31801.1 CDP-diacylglycerol---serine O-phosphatidyltransferase [Pedobacter caeni]
MIIKQIPNAITSANLFTGCIGIVFAFNQDLRSAALCILISLIIDFFDGFAARLLNVSGPMGKELDSLADMVSFGVLPSVILFHMAPKAFFGYTDFPVLSYLAFFIAVFSAYRLAKFNLDTRQTDKFIGVPTPAISAVIASVPFIFESDTFYFDSSTTTVLLYLAFIPLACYLLISEIQLIALKFKKFGFAENKFRYILMISSVLLLLIFKFVGIPLILVLYIILSIIEQKTAKI